MIVNRPQTSIRDQSLLSSFDVIESLITFSSSVCNSGLVFDLSTSFQHHDASPCRGCHLDNNRIFSPNHHCLIKVPTSNPPIHTHSSNCHYVISFLQRPSQRVAELITTFLLTIAKYFSPLHICLFAFVCLFFLGFFSPFLLLFFFYFFKMFLLFLANNDCGKHTFACQIFATCSWFPLFTAQAVLRATTPRQTLYISDLFCRIHLQYTDTGVTSPHNHPVSVSTCQYSPQ